MSAQQAPPRPARPLLRKRDVLKAYDGVERHVAIALGISAQAVNSWGMFVPELSARKLLEIKPELQVKVRYAKA